MLRYFIIVLLLFAGLLPGCQSREEEPGVVAMVNETPIYLEELEVKYDLQNMSWSSLQNPTVSRLKKDYGAILGNLIVQKLVYQALEERRLEVKPEEIAEAEAKVRADYPNGMFEQVLTEECIDLEHWREQLRSSLAQEKFFREVLRPNISLDYKEAENYYHEHLEEFHLPSRVSFLLFSGPGREMVAKAMEQYKNNKNIDQLFKNFDKLDVQDLKMRLDRLPVGWKQELSTLHSGEAGEVTKGEAGYEALFLKERIPSEVLSPAQAYPMVERMLIEEKLQEAFRKWLDEELATAAIFVSEHLLPGAESSTAEEEIEAEEGTSAEEALEQEYVNGTEEFEDLEAPGDMAVEPVSGEERQEVEPEEGN